MQEITGLGKFNLQYDTKAVIIITLATVQI